MRPFPETWRFGPIPPFPSHLQRRPETLDSSAVYRSEAAIPTASPFAVSWPTSYGRCVKSAAQAFLPPSISRWPLVMSRVARLFSLAQAGPLILRAVLVSANFDPRSLTVATSPSRRRSVGSQDDVGSDNAPRLSTGCATPPRDLGLRRNPRSESPLCSRISYANT